MHQFVILVQVTQSLQDLVQYLLRLLFTFGEHGLVLLLALLLELAELLVASLQVVLESLLAELGLDEEEDLFDLLAALLTEFALLAAGLLVLGRGAGLLGFALAAQALALTGVVLDLGVADSLADVMSGGQAVVARLENDELVQIVP